MLEQAAAPSAETLSVSPAKHRNDPAGSLGPFSMKAFLCFATNHLALAPPSIKANVKASKTAIDEHLVVEAPMIKAAIDAAPNAPKGAVSAKFTDDVTTKGAKLEMASPPAMGRILAIKHLLSNLKKWSFFKIFVMVYCFLLFSGVTANSGDQSSKASVTPVGPKFGQNLATEPDEMVPEFQGDVDATQDESSSDGVEDKAVIPFQLDTGIKTLEGFLRGLRGGTGGNPDSAKILLKVKEIGESAIDLLESFASKLRVGDMEGMQALAESSVEDITASPALESFGSKHQTATEEPPDLLMFGLSDKQGNTNTAVDSLRSPQVEMLMDSFIGNARDTMNRIDSDLLDLVSQEQTEDSNSRFLKKSTINEDFSGSEQEHTKFDNYGHFSYNQFNGRDPLAKDSFLHAFHHQHSHVMRMLRSNQHKLGGHLNMHPDVKAKHERRLNALGAQVCRQNCALADAQCNCGVLFDCVRQLTVYDLSVLFADGFIEKAATSGQFANFTVPVEDLKLFGADFDIQGKLKKLQDLALPENKADPAKCNEVLNGIFTACDPNKGEKCRNPNTQSYQMNVAQVCDAVNTRTKLLFEAIGNEYDGFGDKYSTQVSERPLSFEVCSNFVREFDRLYEGRDRTAFPLENPMRINSQQTLYNKLVNTNIFGNTQFPVGYWFPQDRNTGAIKRSFTYSPYGASGNFILSNPSTAQVLQLTGSDCSAKTRLEAVPDSTAITTRHQFYLDSETQQLVSANCSGMVVTREYDNCLKGNSLVLRPFNLSSSSNPNAWSYYKKGFVFDNCIPSTPESSSQQQLVLSSIKEKTKYVKITLIGEGQLLLTRFVSVKSQSGKLLSSATDGASATQSSTFEENERKHNATIAISGEPDRKKSQHCGIKAGEGKYDEDRDAYYYNCFQRTSKEKDPWLKVKLSEEALVASVEIGLPVDYPNELGGGPDGLYLIDGTVNIQLINSDDIVIQHQSFSLSSKVSGYYKNEFTCTNVTLQEAKGNKTQQWMPSFVEPPYNYGLVPGFIEMASSGHGKNRTDAIELAKAAMVTCDTSMSLLVGSQASVGSLRALADLVKDGGQMPGQCCFDTPTSNPQYFGYSFDPTLGMTCQNKGPFHLALSQQACENAGGGWFRSPCITLKKCIDDRPKRFDLEQPKPGTCQQPSGSLNINFVKWAHSFIEANPNTCFSFCQSLPNYVYQTEMMITRSDSLETCTCLYSNDDKLPAITAIPEDAVRSPPKFFLTNPLDGTALTINDCSSLMGRTVKVQKAIGSVRQQFQLTSEGGVASVFCPGMVLSLETANRLQCFANSRLILDQRRASLLLEGADIGDVAILGSQSESSTRQLTVTGSGSDIWRKSDKFHYAYFDISGLEHVAVEMYVNEFKGSSHEWSKGGLMIRNGLNTDSAHYSLFMTGGHGVNSFRRESASSDSLHDGGTVPVTDTSLWLKIEKNGDQFTSFYKRNGSSSYQQFSNSHAITFSSDQMYVGIAVTSRNYAKTAQLKGHSFSVNGFSFALLGTSTLDVQPNQQWEFDSAAGTISNSLCPDRVLSSTWQADGQISSLFFTLSNPRSGMSIGVVGSGPCAASMSLETQKTIPFALNQQFLYEDGKIISAMCPSLSISPETGNGCDAGVQLSLSSMQQASQWFFDEDGIISSMECPNNKLAINSTTLSGARSGSTLIVSNSTRLEWYESWAKDDYRVGLFGPPIYLTNYMNEDAVTVGIDGPCASATIVSHLYSTADTSQQFYFEDKSGRLFSRACHGFVLDSDGCYDGANVVLAPFQDSNIQKWVFGNDGQILKANCGLVLSNNGDNIQLSTSLSNSSTSVVDESSQMWWVESVRLLPINPEESLNPTFNQKWTVADASDGSSYDPSRFSDTAQDGITTCYSATDDLKFNRAFETYAIGYVVQDATDEQMCGLTREKLGFSRDYPFDTEICDEFNSRMCDPLFTQVEATPLDSTTFTEADYTAPEYPDDPDLRFDPLPGHKQFKRNDEIGKHDKLIEATKEEKIARSTVFALRNLYELLTTTLGLQCDIVLFSPAKKACKSIVVVLVFLLHLGVLAAEVTFEVFATKLGDESVGPDTLKDTVYMVESIYENLIVMDSWNAGALNTINQNINNQHTDMRDRLQERHQLMVNDIVDVLETVRNEIGLQIAKSNSYLGEECAHTNRELTAGVDPTPVEMSIREVRELWTEEVETLEVIEAKMGVTRDRMEGIEAQIEGIGTNLEAFRARMEGNESMLHRMMEILEDVG